MKKICVFIGFITLLSACSKKSNVTPSDTNSVTIGGTAYSTVTIGNQVWTTVNYSGAGGYHDASHNQYGDYYTQSQANAISLPSGWRVPSMSDYSTLLSNFTTNKDAFGYYQLDANSAGTLMSTSGWPFTTTDKSGFDAQPAGLFQITGQTTTYQTDGAAAYFMTSDFGNQNDRIGFLVSSGYGANVGASAYSTMIIVSYSLRFVRDK